MVCYGPAVDWGADRDAPFMSRQDGGRVARFCWRAANRELPLVRVLALEFSVPLTRPVVREFEPVFGRIWRPTVQRPE